MPESKDFRGKVLKGGFYLTLRQLLASGLALINFLVVARVLGPEKYGIVSVTIGTFLFLVWTTQIGLNIYLVRQPDLPEDGQEQILFFYNTVGILICIVLWLFVPIIGTWVGQPIVGTFLRCLVPALWLNMIANVSIGMLERELRFTEVGLIEMLSQLGNYFLSVPLVLIYRSYWGPIAGYGLQYLLLAILAYYYYPVAWRRRWHWPFLKAALRYSVTFSSANWVRWFRSLTIPLLVSRLAGIEAAGVISVAMRFIDQLTLLRLVIRRLSISVLAKISDDLAATRKAMGQGMTYQMLLVGPPIAAFSCCAAWLIPMLFGPEWLLSVQVFPFIALTALISTLFDLHASALHAVGQNNEVTKFYLLDNVILWGVAGLTLPSLSLWGYGIAEIATIPSYLLIHVAFMRLYGSPNYWDSFWVIMATAPALLLGPWVPIAASLSLLFVSYGLLVAFRPRIRKILVELYALLRSRGDKSAEAS